MRLGIISDAHHYQDANGQLYTLTLLARQFEQWAALFDEVVVCAPLLSGPRLKIYDAYRAHNIRLLPVPVAGGNTLGAKLQLATTLPVWWAALQHLIASSDAIHIRCPNNISILGLLALSRSPCLRQAVYTGQWNVYSGEPLTYRWQRFMLKHFFSGPVAVYGTWPRQPKHIVPSFSPSYSLTDWEEEAEGVARRIAKLHSDEQNNQRKQEVQLVSVGSLSKNKNQQLIIHAVSALRSLNIEAQLHILGEGPERELLRRLAVELNVSNQVHLHGGVAHEQVRQFYRTADFVVQAPYAEGFGKVPIEAFFHGTIPVLSNVNLSEEIVGSGLRGRVFQTDDHMELAHTIIDLVQHPTIMASMIEAGRAYARDLTLEGWRKHLKEMLEHYWKLYLPTPALERSEDNV